jgi:hypothetical protein
MDISNKNKIDLNTVSITVIGLGKSGEAAAKLGIILVQKYF